MKQFLRIATGAIVLSTAAFAAPIMIDDYSANQAGEGVVDDAGILGGERDVIVSGNIFNAAGGVATATGASNFVLLDYDGNDNDTAVAFLLAGVDLTGGGSNDRFLLDVTAVAGTISTLIRVSENATDVAESIFNISAPGLYQVAFAGMVTGGAGANFASAERITLRFVFDTTGESISFTSFSTGADPAGVPEPSSMALLGVGLGGLWLARRKRKN